MEVEEQPTAEEAEAEAETDVEAEVEGELAEPAVEGEGEPKAKGEEEVEAIPIEEAFERASKEVGLAVLEVVDTEGTEAEQEAERKKRKERSRVVEFDPDTGEIIVRHRRKDSRRTDWQEMGDFEE